MKKTLLISILFLACSISSWAGPVDLNVIEPSQFVHALILRPGFLSPQLQNTVVIVNGLGNPVIVTCPDGTCSGGGGGGGGTSSLFGASFPASGTAAGFISSTGTMAGGNLDANGNLKVDFSNTTIAVTNTGTFAVQAAQSGTWNITNISGTISLPTGASTSALQTTGNTSLASIDTKTPSLGQALAAASVPVVLTAAQITTLTPPTTVTTNQGTSPWIVAGGGTAGTPGTAALTIQGIGSGTPVPVSLASAPTTSVTQGTSPWVVGQSTAANLNATVVGTGTFAAQVTGTITANAGTGQFNVTCTAANCPMNEAQINGVTPLMGNGVTGTGSQRVTIASDNTAFSVNAIQSGTWNIGSITTLPALPAGTNTIGSVKETDGTNTLIIDPCAGQTKTSTPINQAAAGPTTLVAGTSAKKTYVCSMLLITATAQNVNLVEGTGTNCSSVTSGLLGGTTAATGPNLAANGGFAHGEGSSAVASTATNADNLCIIVSGSGQVSGVIETVQQ